MPHSTGPRMDIDWYFDFISPFAYLQWQHLRPRVQALGITCRPLLLAGLLGHHGHRGPAEIPSKRVFTYRHVQWLADSAGLPLRFPPAHPFNPLAALRLCAHAGSTSQAIDTAFNHLWRDGLRGDDAASLAPVAAALGVDGAAAVADPAAKAALQANFERALAQGVFGVPTLVAGGQLFWGNDATAMFDDWLADPALFERPSMRGLAALPVAAMRGTR
jgi:2-hydroxychromene-2-carboxylate isomerase